MKEVEKTIGKLIDHQKIAFIGSVDVDGYPNMKAMLTPRKREGIRTFYFTANTSSMRVSQFSFLPLFLRPSFFSRGDVERYDGSING